MSEKVEKTTFFQKTGRFFKDVKSELKKVVWPTRTQAIHNTGIVILFMVVVAIFLFFVDSIFMVSVNTIIKGTNLWDEIKGLFSIGSAL